MKLVEAGRVIGPHGVGGHVKVLAAVDFEILEDVSLWRVGFSPASVVARRIGDCRRHVSGRGTSLIVQLEGVSTRTEAELLKGSLVFISSEDLERVAGDPDLEEENDVTGFGVVEESGEAVGEVLEILPMPAQDVLVVKLPDGRQAMIPVVPEIVLSVDAERRRLTVSLPEGLID